MCIMNVRTFVKNLLHPPIQTSSTPSVVQSPMHPPNSPLIHLFHLKKRAQRPIPIPGQPASKPKSTQRGSTPSSITVAHSPASTATAEVVREAAKQENNVCTTNPTPSMRETNKTNKTPTPFHLPVGSVTATATTVTARTVPMTGSDHHQASSSISPHIRPHHTEALTPSP